MITMTPCGHSKWPGPIQDLVQGTCPPRAIGLIRKRRERAGFSGDKDLGFRVYSGLW